MFARFPLMTVEEFDETPELEGEFTFELHFGQLVRVSRVRFDQYLMQGCLRDMLRRMLPSTRWFCDIEIPYSLSKRFDHRRADSGVISRQRIDDARKEGVIVGAPELTALIKPRSKPDGDLRLDAIGYLTHGADAVWYLKPLTKQVLVYTAAGLTTYTEGQSIPLPPDMNGEIAVTELFDLSAKPPH